MLLGDDDGGWRALALDEVWEFAEFGRGRGDGGLIGPIGLIGLLELMGCTAATDMCVRNLPSGSNGLLAEGAQNTKRWHNTFYCPMLYRITLGISGIVGCARLVQRWYSTYSGEQIHKFVPMCTVMLCEQAVCFASSSPGDFIDFIYFRILPVLYKVYMGAFTQKISIFVICLLSYIVTLMVYLHSHDQVVPFF